jgi:uncharacterized protein (TIGR03083 family)
MPLTHALALDLLTADAPDLAETVATFDGAELETMVPSCPGWSVRDVVGHLGSVHRWAATVVRTGAVADQPPGPSDPAELAPWFAAGVDELLAALGSAVPGEPCWGFGPPPRLVDFWVRRQALETSMHRWDVLAALDRQPELDARGAEDGVDEVVTLMFPRQVRLGRLEPLTDVVRLRVAETGSTWVLAGDGVGDADGSGADTAEVTVTASAADLFLLLWRRIVPTDPRVTLTGDRAAAIRVLSSALTP